MIIKGFIIDYFKQSRAPTQVDFSIISHHQLQDRLRMAYPPHHWEWIHPFQAFRHNKSSSAAGHTENCLTTPSMRMDTPISDVSRHQQQQDELWMAYPHCIHSQWWRGQAIFSASYSWWGLIIDFCLFVSGKAHFTHVSNSS